MSTHYEWDMESHEGDDIVDHNFGETVADLGLPELPGDHLVLVRTDVYGFCQWAYVREDKTLPEFFSIPEADGNYYETATRVPKRFHQELAKLVRREVSR